MRRLITSLILVGLVCGCSGPKGFPNRQGNIASQIGREHGLAVICFGARQVEEGEVYIYGYQCSRPLDKRDARTLLVDLASELADSIPYQDTTESIGLSRLDVSIYMREEDGARLFYPKLGIVKLREYEVEFAYWDPDDQYEFHTRTYETWDEALSKVHEHSEVS